MNVEAPRSTHGYRPVPGPPTVIVLDVRAAAPPWVWIALVVLVALLVVATVAAFLALMSADETTSGPATWTPRLESARDLHDAQANVAKARSDVAAMGQAVQLYRIRIGRLPDTLEELVDGPGDVDPDEYQWRPLLSHIPRDPWDNEYLYEILDEDIDVYEIVSFGADGDPGGAGFDADIVFPARDD